MRQRILLAAFLLGVGLFFIPILGHGRVKHSLYYESEITYMDFRLLEAKVDYIMKNPTSFLRVHVYYDPDGRYQKSWKFPKSIDTAGKIVAKIKDDRGVFSDKSGKALLDLFKRELELVYCYIHRVATDMDTDIVAKFYSVKDIPIGYFYQGEYHLWEE